MRPPTFRLRQVRSKKIAGLVVAVPVAWASHEFTDVPDSNPFHGDISAVKGAGITSGKTCTVPGTPPTFCPSEGISREAMSAFVHRGLGRAGTGAGTAIVSDATDTDVAVITISVGGVAGGTQFVVLNAGLSGEIEPADGGCPCETAFRITQDGVGGITNFGFFTNTLNFASGFNTSGGGVTTVVAVPSATTQTFRLQAQVDGGTGSVLMRGNISATTAAFGSTGSSTLAVPKVSKASSPRG